MVEEYVDHGISGAKGRDKRPAFDRLLKDATRRRFDVIMAWSADRLGRSLHEVEKLREIEPGSDYNLSSEEITVFRNLGQQADAEAVNAAWRRILAGRTQAYLQDGLDGIAPYDRGGDSSSAADDLRAATEASKVLQQATPELYQALLAYPNQELADVQHQFSWTQQEADDRPVYILTHRIRHGADPGGRGQRRLRVRRAGAV